MNEELVCIEMGHKKIVLKHLEHLEIVSVTVSP